MKWKKIILDIYPCTVYLCKEKNGRKVLNKIKRLGFTVSSKDRDNILSLDNAGVACPLLRKGGGDEFLLLVRTAYKTPADVSIICHEALHATYYIFKYIGLDGIKEQDDEVHAYLLDFLVEKSLDFFWK